MQQLGGQGARRRGVENDAGVVFVREADRGGDGFQRNLQLHEHDHRSADRRFCRRDVFRQQGGVRARCDADHIFAGGIHQNQRDAGRGRLGARDMFARDPFGLVLRQRLIAHRIAPQPRDERDRATEPRRGDSLVRALAAARHCKFAAQDRFARLGQVRAFQNHICVRATHDDNVAHPVLPPFFVNIRY